MTENRTIPATFLAACSGRGGELRQAPPAEWPPGGGQIAGWHIGSRRSGPHTYSMITATRPTQSQTQTDEAVTLIEAYRTSGDRRAIERIFSMHAKILNHIVRRYSQISGEPYEDLLQVGYIGLIKAVNGYKPDSSEARFSSYAYAMIDGELRHHFRDTEMVRKPRWARSLYTKVSEANVRLSAKLGRPPLVEEIAREVNVSTEGVVEVMKLFHETEVASLDGTPSGEGMDLSAIRSLQHESFSLPVEDRIQLEQALESLTELQRKVVYLFFYKDLTQTEIGSRLKLPQRKISRVIASAMKSLRESYQTGDEVRV
jgi:RNA polymerase sigma-B factor